MNQHVAVSPRRQRRSALARPELTYQWERFPALMREIAPLFLEHWHEIATNKAAIPLDPNYDLFCQYDLAGVLHVLTVRADGALVGYLFAMIGPHLHYESTLWGHVDMFWLKPAYRSGWTGVKMFRVFEEWARERGVKMLNAVEKLHFHNKSKRRVALLFKRLGYVATERVYRKLLR